MDQELKKGRGAHNLSPEARRANGRKGGQARVAKGFAKMDAIKLKEITSKGGKRRAQRSRKIQAVLRGDGIRSKNEREV